MSATTTLNGHGRYKDQLKLLRAETAASWLAVLVGHLFGESRSAPSAVVKDQGAPAQRWYGAYY